MFAPSSDWTPPTELVDLSRAKIIGIDVESKDPNLMKMGPGFIRGDAKAVGISLAADLDGPRMYLPFDHEGGGNMDRAQVLDFVKVQVSRSEQIKCGANLMYECEALASLGIEMKGPLQDIQVAEPLLDENREEGYSLEALSWHHLQRGKNEKKLLEAAAQFQIDPKKDLHRLHSKYVGEYAIDDAWLPIAVLEKQLPLLSDEKLDRVWKLESDLLPILWKMRARGIRVDLDYFERLGGEMQAMENLTLQKIWAQTGYKVDPWSSKSLAVFMNQLGLGFHIQYTPSSKTHPSGQPSFKNEWFLKMAEEHPEYEVFQWLKDFRVMGKMRRDFVEGMILGFNVRGRLHPQWHQLRQDDEDRENGTKTGRIASSKPNLTQIPIRDPMWGKKIRKGFVADEGGKYCKHDFSSQEPRIMLHFAYIKNYKGAAEVRQKYIDDPSLSYHKIIQELILERTNKDIGYRPAKDINLGSAYGMGFRKLCKKLGIGEDEGKALLKTYHEGVPYVKKLEERCMLLVQTQGFIRTVLGRKRRFIMWEPRDWERKRNAFAVASRELAVQMWGNDVERADAHKALNAVCQGSAADQTKQAIIDLDAVGLTPQIQVYDELGQTIWEEKHAWVIKEIMENAIAEFTVPHQAWPELGDDWGSTVDMVR
jgi:DNA polymerase I-like protein with 3'-5' exonuclease and polymerase domains